VAPPGPCFVAEQQGREKREENITRKKKKRRGNRGEKELPSKASCKINEVKGI